MNSAELIVSILEKAGVEYVFGIPGGAIEDLSTAIYNCDKIKPILAKHEEGAAFMADGYARLTRKLGVCCATAGPGASNLITGLATSFADGIPVCALTGQVATTVFGKGALQESGAEGGVNIVSVFRHFTKYSGMLINEKRTQYMIEKAIRLAHSCPSGPVHLNLPADIMGKNVPDISPFTPKFEDRLFDRKSVKKAATILNMAKKPAIIAGWGVVLSKGAAELLTLAQLLNIPVATSPKAKGIFPEDHPLSLGVLGFGGSQVAKEYLLSQDIDVLIGVGTSFNEMMTAGWDQRLSPSNHLIHIDVNPERIGKNYYASLGIVGDAQTVLKELNYGIRREAGVSPDATFIKGVLKNPDIEKLKSRFDAEDPMPPSSELYHPRHLMTDIQKSFPPDTAYFCDIGNVMAWSIRYLVLERPYSFFVPMGFSGMGYGAAAPVGARLGSGNQTVVGLVGDGGFLMNGFEVATAVNYDIPAIWIIFNNAMLGMVYHSRKMLKKQIPEGIPSRFRQVNFAKVAEGLGAIGIRIEKSGELTPELVDDILAQKRPAVIDVVIDNEATPPLHSRIQMIDRYFEGVPLRS